MSIKLQATSQTVERVDESGAPVYDENGNQIVDTLNGEYNVFEIGVESLKHSKTLWQMVEDLGGVDAVQTIGKIPVANATDFTLSKFVEYATWLSEQPAIPVVETKEEETEPKEGEEQKPKEGDEQDKKAFELTEWEKEFCNVETKNLFVLIQFANYLDCKRMLDATCKTVAEMIQGKTPEQIRETFNIKNDFTPEEEEAIRKENEWYEG
jgi:S-phase kinase-associated protein 1